MITEAEYLADKPTLRAALADFHAAELRLAELETALENAKAEDAATYRRQSSEVRAILDGAGVERYNDLSAEQRHAVDTIWATAARTEDAAQTALLAVADPLAVRFTECEDEEVRRFFRWLNGPFRLSEWRECLSRLALKADGRRLRGLLYARPGLGIRDAALGDTVFFPHPRSTLCAVVKITPTGRVDGRSLITETTERFTSRSWPDGARAVPPALAQEVMEFHSAWQDNAPFTAEESAHA